MKRYVYDLSHYSFMAGEVNRLQTLSCIPVVAGDSLGISVNGIMRFSPLRRDLVMDARLDLFAFFVPHRHIYDTLWTEYIKEGHAEDVALTTDSIATTAPLRCVGYNSVSGTVPRWITRGYLQIWERYFRHPPDRDWETVVNATSSA